MAENKQKRKIKDIVMIVLMFLFLVVYLAVMIRMNHTNSRIYFAGCIWRITELNHIVLVLLWLWQCIDRFVAVRKTEDPELRAKRVRSLRFFVACVGILLVCEVLSVVINLRDRRHFTFAELQGQDGRSILLSEEKKAERISVYSKKGCIVRHQDEVTEFLYANTNMVTNGQYTYETDGKTVTVRFETGGFGKGIRWSEESGETAPPDIIEKQYALPD